MTWIGSDNCNDLNTYTHHLWFSITDSKERRKSVKEAMNTWFSELIPMIIKYFHSLQIPYPSAELKYICIFPGGPCILAGLRTAWICAFCWKMGASFASEIYLSGIFIATVKCYRKCVVSLMKFTLVSPRGTRLIYRSGAIKSPARAWWTRYFFGGFNFTRNTMIDWVWLNVYETLWGLYKTCASWSYYNQVVLKMFNTALLLTSS